MFRTIKLLLSAVVLASLSGSDAFELSSSTNLETALRHQTRGDNDPAKDKKKKGFFNRVFTKDNFRVVSKRSDVEKRSKKEEANRCMVVWQIEQFAGKKRTGWMPSLPDRISTYKDIKDEWVCAFEEQPRSEHPWGWIKRFGDVQEEGGYNVYVTGSGLWAYKNPDHVLAALTAQASAAASQFPGATPGTLQRTVHLDPTTETLSLTQEKADKPTTNLAKCNAYVLNRPTVADDYPPHFSKEDRKRIFGPESGASNTPGKAKLPSYAPNGPSQRGVIGLKAAIEHI